MQKRSEAKQSAGRSRLLVGEVRVAQLMVPVPISWKRSSRGEGGTVVNGWRLAPAGVGSALAAAQDSVEQIRSGLTDLSSAPESLAGGAGGDGVVASAFASFLEEQAAGPLASMMGRYSAAVTATASAAEAYVAGDEEMAANFVRGAGQVASTEDSPRFTRRGTAW